MRRFLLYGGDREIEVRETPLPRPAAGEVLVVSRLSAISAGSELLVFRGEAGVEQCGERRAEVARRIVEALECQPDAVLANAGLAPDSSVTSSNRQSPRFR